MRSTVVLLLLLGCCLTGAQLQDEVGEITQRNLQPDIWTELQKLEDMVVEQRVQLGVLEARLKTSESQVVELKTENDALREMVVEQRFELGATKTELGAVGARLKTSENQVEELKRENAAQALGLRAMEDRANSTELQLEEQKTVVEELKSTVEELKRENAAVLQLEVGDQVYVRLPSNNQVFDNSDNHSTFSGFLLFPL